MKPICRLIPLAALTTLLVASSVGAADFRSVDWGASRQEVRKAEKLSVHHDLPEEISFWSFKLAGVNAGLIYSFEDERLVRAFYLSRHRTRDPREDHASGGSDPLPDGPAGPEPS